MKKKTTKKIRTEKDDVRITYGGFIGDNLTTVTAQPTGLQKTTYTYR